jgi:Flp pilus assembly pilin Flp
LSKGKLVAGAHSGDNRYWPSCSGGRRIRTKQIWQTLRRARADASGASAAEYAIILGVVGGSIAVAALTLGDAVACSLDRSAATVAGQDLPPGHQYGNSDPNGLAKGHRINC